MERMTSTSQLQVGDELKLVANKQRPFSWFHGFEDQDIILTVVKICDSEPDEEPNFFYSFLYEDEVIYEEYVEGTFFTSSSFKADGEVYRV